MDSGFLPPQTYPSVAPESTAAISRRVLISLSPTHRIVIFRAKG